MMALLFACWAMNGAHVVVGAQEARYQVQAGEEGFVFPRYANNGFAQTVRLIDGTMEVNVEVRNRPLNSRVPGRIPTPLPKGLEGLEAKLGRASHGRLTDQVALIFDWMRNQVAYDETPGLPQDAVSVLTSRKGDCVGFANAAIGLLSHLGLKARGVTGVAFKLDDPVRLQLQGRVLHRWVEIQYDDVGWVFSDPSGKIHFVDATYVVLAVHDGQDVDASVRDAIGSEIELMSLRNGFRSVTRQAGLDGRLSIRPNVLTAPHSP